MVNEDIVTSLRNAVDRGESLENAMRMLINSGYPQNEVQDASKFIGFFPVSGNKISQNASNQNIIIKSGSAKPIAQPTIREAPLPPRLPPPNAPFQQQTQQVSSIPKYPAIQQLPAATPSQQEIKTEISRPYPQMQNLPPISSQRPMQLPPPIPRYPSPNEPPPGIPETPPKPSYKKEIVLLIILLLLIGFLISTILLMNRILAFFS